MGNKEKWKKAGLTMLTASALLLTACGGETDQEALVDGESISLVYVAWDDLIASTNVVATVLEDVGYDVTTTVVDNAIMWESLASGDADAMVSGWLPHSHGPQYEEYGENMIHAGVNLEGAHNGITVPAYMEVDSIEDLTDEAGQVITGIEPGASIMMEAQNTIDAYDNLDGWELSSSSSGAMATQLGQAIENEEEIVVTGWQPHWKFLEYDLKMLDDPHGHMGDMQTVNTFVREGFPEDEPIAYSILENFYWEMEDIEEVMADISGGQSPEDAARQWVDDNQDIVDQWTAEAEELAAGQMETAE